MLASIFLGVFVGLYSGFLKGRERTEFTRDAEQLAQRVQFLAAQDTGAQQPFDIAVPGGCELKFENQSVIAVTNGSHSYGAGINVVGGNLGSGSYHLMLKRSENGVEINVG